MPTRMEGERGESKRSQWWFRVVTVFLMRPIVWVCSLGLYPSFSISCVVCAQSASHVPLFANQWTAACQAPLSMGFHRQEYWIWLAISFSKGSSQLRDQTLVSCISCIAVRFFIILATRVATISKKVKVKVVSDSLQLRGSQPARLLCPWNSPGQDIGVDCHSFLQGIFPTQGSNTGLLRCRWVLYHLSHQKRLTISWSLLRFMSIELVTLSNHLILSCPLLLLPSIFSSIRIFSSESALCIKWPSIGASASASVLPMNIQGWFPLGLTGVDLLAIQGTLKSFLQHYNSKASILRHSAFFFF